MIYRTHCQQTQGTGVSAEPTVVEGGTIEVKVQANVKTLRVAIPGRGVTRVPVADGKAEIAVPPGVPGGTIILITDGVMPSPSSTSVTVVGSHS